MNNYIFLPLAFLKFWYLEAPRTLFGFFASLNSAFFQLFSLPLFLRTFFKPLKNEYREGLVVFSRVIGMILKTFLIFVDLIIFIVMLLIEVVVFFAFLLFPAATIFILFIKFWWKYTHIFIIFTGQHLSAQFVCLFFAFFFFLFSMSFLTI